MTQKRRPKKGDELTFFRNLGGDELVEDVKNYEQFYESEQATPPDLDTLKWRSAGKVQLMQGYEGGMRLTCEFAVVDLFWMAEDCLRVRVKHAGEFDEPFSYGVEERIRKVVRYDLFDRGDFLIMRTSAMVCRVNKSPFQLRLETIEGLVLCADQQGPQLSDTGAVRLSLKMKLDEESFGLGERAHSLNLRGDRYTLWNTDQPDCDRGTDPLYYSIPFYLGLHGDGAYGVYWDNSFRGFVDVGAEKTDTLTFAGEDGELRYYLIGHRDVEQVVSRYTDLTGRISLPPLWFLGYQQCRFSYYPDEEVMQIADELRQRQIPCDVIYLDIHYMDKFKVFTWDPKQFVNFRAMADGLHSQGFKLVVIIDPGVKIERGYGVYESGLAEDVFVKTSDGTLVRGVVWPGACHMPDFSSERTRQWWVEQAKILLDAGVDGIWNDMNEPALFATTGAVTLPDTVLHEKEGKKALHKEIHNVYGHLMSRATREALEAHKPDKRVVNITRAGFAGTQRYASSWTGDVSSDWDHLRLSIPMVLNMGISGVALTGPDVGGFRGDTTAELLTRWTQAACLMPFFRNHSAIDTIRQEPWVFGSLYEEIVRKAVELRYQLMPYLYSVVAQSSEYGVPIVRPVFMLDQDNPELRDVDDQYMLGNGLLVAPIVEEGASKRQVVLPQGDWYDFWTNELIAGGQTITVHAPLNHLPLFVKGGTFLPMWPVMQHLSFPQNMWVRVYPGINETVLYEDAGEGYGYKTGEFRWIYVSSEWKNNRLRIQRRTAGAYESPYAEVKMEIVGFDEEPMDVRLDHRGAPVWFYEDGLIELSVGEFELLEITQQVGPSDETIVRRPW